MDYYSQIAKRKSFHIFRGAGAPLTEAELAELRAFLAALTPLEPSIRVQTRIVPEGETTSHRGAEYCVLFYSEKKGDYLRNVGYMGQQLDLYLVSRNIGSLWVGMSRPKEMTFNGLDYVIMIALARMEPEQFRRDMTKAKRKPLVEIWQGDDLGVADTVRYAPSAVNSQPWFTESREGVLTVYRVRPGRLGIVPMNVMGSMNRIDLGIFLFLLETCLRHRGYAFRRELAEDGENVRDGKILNAVYRLEPAGTDREAQGERITKEETV